MVGKVSVSRPRVRGVHHPVMVAEVLVGLNIDSQGTYLDATFGAGGHSRALLEKLGPTGCLLGLDADPAVSNFVTEIDDKRLDFRHANYRDMAAHVAAGSVDGVLMDLGLSMIQLTDAKRGFTLLEEGPLDMRMDTTGGKTLAELLRRVSEKQLGKILLEFGEERRWRSIAAALVRRRKDGLLAHTTDITAVCIRGCGWKKVHPATRVFQALRIWVNNELGNLAEGLAAAAKVLRPGGRLVVTSFHSLEDRIVKRFFKPLEGGPGLFTPLGKMQKPSEAEVNINRASRSAKLRVGQRR